MTAQFTGCELQVIKLLAEGKRVDYIAKELNRSVGTIRSQIQSASIRSGCETQLQLVLYCLQRGIVKLPEL